MIALALVHANCLSDTVVYCFSISVAICLYIDVVNCLTIDGENMSWRRGSKRISVAVIIALTLL